MTRFFLWWSVHNHSIHRNSHSNSSVSSELLFELSWITQRIHQLANTSSSHDYPILLNPSWWWHLLSQHVPNLAIEDHSLTVVPSEPFEPSTSLLYSTFFTVHSQHSLINVGWLTSFGCKKRSHCSSESLLFVSSTLTDLLSPLSTICSRQYACEENDHINI